MITFFAYTWRRKNTTKVLYSASFTTYMYFFFFTAKNTVFLIRSIARATMNTKISPTRNGKHFFFFFSTKKIILRSEIEDGSVRTMSRPRATPNWWSPPPPGLFSFGKRMYSKNSQRGPLLLPVRFRPENPIEISHPCPSSSPAARSVGYIVVQVRYTLTLPAYAGLFQCSFDFWGRRQGRGPPRRRRGVLSCRVFLTSRGFRNIRTDFFFSRPVYVCTAVGG